jgi:3,4-dihydroxy 2-butanone 4-phosphate synthase/GTP cyclohydrolase II
MLRASHDAILVGIGTVLADDPQLNNRLVPGPSPQPVILDTYLRIPLNSRLMQRDDQMPWIFIGHEIDTTRRNAYEGKGAAVFICAGDGKGYLNLSMIIHYLNKMGVRSVMVEGGARVISSFLRDRLVDRAVVTLAPVWLAGLPVFERNPNRTRIVFPPTYPRLSKPVYQQVGTNLVVCGLVEECRI